jgi:hypothetical protein
MEVVYKHKLTNNYIRLSSIVNNPDNEIVLIDSIQAIYPQNYRPCSPITSYRYRVSRIPTSEDFELKVVDIMSMQDLSRTFDIVDSVNPLDYGAVLYDLRRKICTLLTEQREYEFNTGRGKINVI